MKTSLVILSFIVAVVVAEPLLGIEHIGAGRDTVTGKRRLPAVELTYSEGRTWRNPLTDTTHEVCDQCVVTLSTEADLAVVAVVSAAEYAGLVGGAGGEVEKTPYSISGTYGAKAVAGLFAEEKVVVVLKETVVLYVVVVASLHPNSSALLEETMKEMPSAYAPQHYRKVISRFGTHFTSQAEFGGEATLIVAMNASAQAIVEGEVDVKQVALGIFNNMKGSSDSWVAGGGAAYAFGAAASADLQTVTYLTLKGGFFENINYDAWVSSLKTAPAVVRSELTPIAELIRDPKQQINMYQAISEYTH